MTKVSSRRQRFTLLAAPATALAALLLLTGCSNPFGANPPPGPDSPGAPQSGQSGSSSQPDGSVKSGDSAGEMPVGDGPSDGDGAKTVAPGKGEVTLMFDLETFTFAPTTCVNKPDEKLRISGPGVDDESQSPQFLDIDIVWDGPWPKGTIYVYLGAEKAAPTKTFFVGRIGEEGVNYSMGHTMEGYDVRTDLSNEQGFAMGMGAFTINCE